MAHAAVIIIIFFLERKPRQLSRVTYGSVRVLTKASQSSLRGCRLGPGQISPPSLDSAHPQGERPLFFLACGKTTGTEGAGASHVAP